MAKKGEGTKKKSEKKKKQPEQKAEPKPEKKHVEQSGKIVVLDPGHGFPDSGAVGVKGTQEQWVVLDVCKRAQKILADNGITALLTRKTGLISGGVDSTGSSSKRKMINDSLRWRVQFAKEKKADAFVSVHCNAFTSPKATGFEVWYNNQGAELGEQLFKEMEAQLKTHKARRVTLARYFVLRKNRIPAALVELEFLSNPEQEEIFLKEASREFYAKTLALGIRKYLT